MQRVTTLFEQYVKLCQALNYETMISAVAHGRSAKLPTLLPPYCSFPSKKSRIAGNFDPSERLSASRCSRRGDRETKRGSHDPVARKAAEEKAQKEYYLNEKIKAIQKETGARREERIRRAEKEGRSPPACRRTSKTRRWQELKKLEAMPPPMSAESTVSRNYLDWLLAGAWKKRSKEIRNISRAEKVLNEDHYGLEKIKERILEFLAVRQLVKNPKALFSVLSGLRAWVRLLSHVDCQGQGRKFVRMSLGGVRDEAEIRGHRRTYIGALPGQIIQMMKKAGTKNPVLHAGRSGQDVDGFPRRSVGRAAGSARPPSRISCFVDHYLDVRV